VRLVGPQREGPSEYSLVEDHGGVILEVPTSIDVNSPAFQMAAKTCHLS
jgi:hypothetical protein